MKIGFWLLFAISIVGAGTSSAQTPAPADGLDLLKRVAKHYADAKSYHIRATQEYESHNDLQRNWQKSIIEAAEAPDHRCHYEGRGGMGAALRISDGKQVWSYHADDHIYTAKSVEAKNPDERRIIPFSEMVLNTSENVRNELGGLARSYKSATRMPDTYLDLNGRSIACYVVNLTGEDRKRAPRPGESAEETIWIDKASETVVKRTLHEHTFVFGGGGKAPIESEITTVYAMTELDHPVADELFSFAPPEDAKLVDHFPDPLTVGPSLEGQVLPALRLTTVDGKAIPTESLRGKPVLLDIWATWCAPCVKGLEKLAAIERETNKGLTIITIDQDEDADTAKAFLAKKGYSWPNVHDDGNTTAALGGTGGIPRSILVNSEGKIVYDKTSDDEQQLRGAIAKLGPEFASLAPKPVPAPCGTVVSSNVPK